ncbi:MAG: 2-phosphosulfolactate phosphatase [Candidatus Acidiferrales bacterium]|jgi:2-phosphosulfolactate phosphatase
MRNSVVIDCFQENPAIHRDGYAIVAIDVIRATTTAITAVALGRRCFPVPSVEVAKRLQTRLTNPLLAGEVGGYVLEGFEANNSPAEIAMRRDIERPLVLISSSGTKLIHAARKSDFTYLASFRNHSTLSQHLIDRHSKVALIGAGTRGEFREEDQICCAWIARQLIAEGYEPENARTTQIVDVWGAAPEDACLCSQSAEYLRRSGQTRDLDFTLSHIDDLPFVYMMKDDEVVSLTDRGRGEIQPSLNDLTHEYQY